MSAASVYFMRGDIIAVALTFFLIVYILLCLWNRHYGVVSETYVNYADEPPPVTFVTALYDIGREQKGDGRKFSSYLEWFDETLSYNVHMIVFVEPELQSRVLQIRSRYDTRMTVCVGMHFKDTGYYKYLDDIAKVLTSEYFRSRIKAIDRIECQMPEYIVVQFDKFEFLKYAIEHNPFGSTSFFWIDAGISRFVHGKNEVSLKQGCAFSSNSTTVYLESSIVSQGTWGEEYDIWESTAMVMGTFFGGNKDQLSSLISSVRTLFEHYLFKEHAINNEQVLLAILKFRMPELFTVVPSEGGLTNALMSLICQGQ